MKGLLLKDFYMVTRRCRLNLGVSLLFVVLGAAGQTNAFMLLFPCLMCAMIPVTLLAHDEHDKWDVYAATLPYTRAQMVSAKYIVGFLPLVGFAALTALAQGARMLADGTFTAAALPEIFIMLLVGGMVPSAICLPFIFKLGSEKGRVVYMLVVGLFSAIPVAAGEMGALMRISPLVLLLPTAAVYALSWCLSARLYKNRVI